VKEKGHGHYPAPRDKPASIARSGKPLVGADGKPLTMAEILLEMEKAKGKTANKTKK